jgi:hypothetical protein
VATSLTRIQEMLNQSINHHGFPQPIQTYAGILPRLGHHLFKILFKLSFIIIHPFEAM